MAGRDQHADSIDQLIALGRRQGYVTFDEVKAHIPPHLYAARQFDPWLVALEEHAIPILLAPPQPPEEDPCEP